MSEVQISSGHRAVNWNYALNIKCECGQIFKANDLFDSINLYAQHVLIVSERQSLEVVLRGRVLPWVRRRGAP